MMSPSIMTKDDRALNQFLKKASNEIRREQPRKAPEIGKEEANPFSIDGDCDGDGDDDGVSCAEAMTTATNKNAQNATLDMLI